jgi:hypothetical protein
MTQELRGALADIKAMVVGDARPRWGIDPQTTATRGHIADICDAALASAPAEREPVTCHVADIGFRWDGERQQHIPRLLIEFEPVPANSPCDAKGWRDRDALTEMLKAGAAPSPSADPAEQAPIAELRRALAFRDQVRAENPSAATGFCAATGFLRNAHEWIETAARAVVAAQPQENGAPT